MRDFCAVLLSSFALLFSDAFAVTIPTVAVGDSGNVNDSLTGSLYGGVDYRYRIGATEVTNAQYAEFLNAKAASDPLALYNTNMGSNVRGGIARSGFDGSYSYAPKASMADKPVNYVNWYDAIRFANWLHNGQGLGDTESGAYTILGGSAEPSNGMSIVRNSEARWFLTSENEWYKAAYYQPATQGGDADGYWLYPTLSNASPTVATANGGGDISNPGVNVANTSQGAIWNSVTGNVTTVGSAGPSSQGFYGTSDQGGNVLEWNEALIDLERGLRGGSFSIPTSFLQSLSRARGDAMGEDSNLGFRVATVPEPSTVALAAIGLLALLGIARRRAP